MKSVQIKFNIWHKLPYGKAIYITGGCEQLGNWDKYKSVRLEWNEGDIWKSDIIIDVQSTSTLEYKYLISDFKDSIEYMWEKGPNRVITINPKINVQKNMNCILLREDKWEQRKVIIKLVDKINLTQEQISLQQQQFQQNLPNLIQYQYYIKGNIKSFNSNDIMQPLKMIFKSKQQVIQTPQASIQQQQQVNSANNNNNNNKITSFHEILSPELMLQLSYKNSQCTKCKLNGNKLVCEQCKKLQLQNQAISNSLQLQKNLNQQQNLTNTQKESPQDIKNKDSQQQNIQSQQQYQNWWEIEGYVDIIEDIYNIPTFVDGNDQNQIQQNSNKGGVQQTKKQQVKYCFIKQDLKSQSIQVDRQVRRIDINNYFNEKDKLVVVNSQPTFKFVFSQIDSNLFLGPYPSNYDDIQQLKQNGVQAILNLQTDEDMQWRGINWEQLQGIYSQEQIKVFQMPIIDMDSQDMSQKLIQVSDLLNNILKTYNKVYVHCTAGIFRSPLAIIGYFCFFKKYNVNEAIQIVESKHSLYKRNTSKAYLKTVLQKLVYQHANQCNQIQQQQYQQIQHDSQQQQNNCYKSTLINTQNNQFQQTFNSSNNNQNLNNSNNSESNNENNNYEQRKQKNNKINSFQNLSRLSKEINKNKKINKPLSYQNLSSHQLYEIDLQQKTYSDNIQYSLNKHLPQTQTTIQLYND